MATFGIFVGTAGGTSLKIANELVKAFDIDESDLINMEDDFDDIDQLLKYDVLFLGSSTWGAGDPHYTWVDPLLEVRGGEYDFTGKIVAFFGAGDSVKHAPEFLSALGVLHEVFTKAGAKAIGFLPKDLYTYEGSKAEIGGKICGCGIDEHNQADKTPERIATWIETLKKELSALGV